MFGPKLSKVFKSRWHALFWAGSILLTAYCSVPSPDQPGDADQMASLVATMHKGDKHADHVNPWAKDTNVP